MQGIEEKTERGIYLMDLEFDKWNTESMEELKKDEKRRV